MKEVFEKIVEILENKAHEAEKDMQLSDSYADAQVFGGKQEGYENAIEIVKQVSEEYSNGHFGCNTNGEHERCDGCGLTDCKNRNKIWFCVGDDYQESNAWSNGWIPCSERVPKVEDLHEKSVDDCTCYLIQRRCGIMDVAHYIKVYGEPYFEANSIKMKDVVAWQPLPEPYQPNACKDTDCPYNDGNECPAAEGCAGYETKGVREA